MALGMRPRSFTQESDGWDEKRVHVCLYQGKYSWSADADDSCQAGGRSAKAQTLGQCQTRANLHYKRQRAHRRDADRDELGPSEPPSRWLVAMRFAGSQWCASAASYTGTASARERPRGRCTRCNPALASGDQGLVDRVWVCPVVQVKPVPGSGNPFGFWRIIWVAKCRYQSWPNSKAGTKQGSWSSTCLDIIAHEPCSVSLQSLQFAVQLGLLLVNDPTIHGLPQ